MLKLPEGHGGCHCRFVVDQSTASGKGDGRACVFGGQKSTGKYAPVCMCVHMKHKQNEIHDEQLHAGPKALQEAGGKVAYLGNTRELVVKEVRHCVLF